MLKQIILEIRYKSAPTFFDCRGEIINEAKRYFKHWVISGDNSVEVIDDERKFRGFVSERNAGASMSEPHTGVFSDTSRNFLDKTMALTNTTYDDIKRIGVRLKFALPVDKQFADLVTVFENNLFKDGLQKKLGDFKIVDVGVPLNFEIDGKKCNVKIGPMEKKQFSLFFPDLENLPNVGVFIDFDCFIDNFKSLSRNSGIIKTHLDKSIEASNDFVEKVKNILKI